MSNLHEMTTKIETLDQRHVDNTPMGSGRQLYKLTNYLLRRFETQALRCLSYMPMPEHSFMLNAVLLSSTAKMISDLNGVCDIINQRKHHYDTFANVRNIDKAIFKHGMPAHSPRIEALCKFE